MNVMMLAAGLGTRLRPFTLQTPKPAIPFLTVPMACYSLALFEKIKIENLVVNTHHLPAQIEHVYAKIHWPCKRLIFSHEPKILGSGGGIRQAVDDLVGDGAFLVANGDEIILPNQIDVMKDALAFHKYHKGIATLLSMPHPEVGTRFGGLWVDANKPDQQVQCFSKTPVAGTTGLHFIGVMILSDRIREYFNADAGSEENILYETLTRAMAQGERVHAFNIDCQWFETGDPVSFLSATEACLQELRQPQPAPWAQHLAQVIRLHSHREFVIEESKLEVKALITQQLPNILSGSL